MALGLDQLREIPEETIAAAIDHTLPLLKAYVYPTSSEEEFRRAKIALDLDFPFGTVVPATGPVWLAERALYQHSFNCEYISEDDLMAFAEAFYKWRDRNTGQIIGTQEDKERALAQYRTLFEKMNQGYSADILADPTYAELADLGLRALDVKRDYQL